MTGSRSGPAHAHMQWGRKLPIAVLVVISDPAILEYVCIIVSGLVKRSLVSRTCVMSW